MKKHIVCIWLIVLIVAVPLSSGCEADIPTSYPQIELPPTKGQSTSIVIDDIIEVPASELWHKTIEIPETLQGVKMIGWCTASGGARNDIKVLVLNDIDFHNWRNFSKVTGLYQSEKTTVADIDVKIPGPGKYHLVVSNWFSEFSSKKVIAKVYLYWSVKPFPLEIGVDSMATDNDMVQIPASANVTVTFDNEECASSVRVNRDAADATPVSVSVNGTEVKFIAPTEGNYIIKCSDTSQSVGKKFEIIPSSPTIGRGMTVDSSTPNAPPRLNRIGDHTIEAGDVLQFKVEAVDPDDDPLLYYACNLPEGASFNGTSREFSWIPSRAGTYFVHFEASDGVLKDEENITIEVK
jgi:hypothetical protein